jgi:hypothetical protein
MAARDLRASQGTVRSGAMIRFYIGASEHGSSRASGGEERLGEVVGLRVEGPPLGTLPSYYPLPCSFPLLHSVQIRSDNH